MLWPATAAVATIQHTIKEECTFTCDCGYKLGGTICSSVRACQETLIISGVKTQFTKELST